MKQIFKGELRDPNKFKERFANYIQFLKKKEKEIYFSVEELSELLLSACRSNDFSVIELKGKKMFLNENNISKWITEKLKPNTVIINLDDEDIMRLFIFCIEITYQMFAGGTRATITQKGFRGRKRTFEAIFIDQFVGKLGEIMVKKFFEKNFNVNVKLDWEISPRIERYESDIINAKKKVSIKSSLASGGIWGEARKHSNYGISVKCFVPQSPILQFFIETCGFAKLLDFAEKKIPPSNGCFKSYFNEIRKRIKEYKCGKIKTKLKGFVCGYFKTSKNTLKKKGENLPYLGEVREERHLVPINELKYKKNDWANFMREIGLK